MSAEGCTSLNGLKASKGMDHCVGRVDLLLRLVGLRMAFVRFMAHRNGKGWKYLIDDFLNFGLRLQPLCEVKRSYLRPYAIKDLLSYLDRSFQKLIGFILGNDRIY